MGLRRFLRDFRHLNREVEALQRASAEAEQQASLELTQSASDFSRKTRDVVDDKLSFSATLMRAGEVHAANRLLEEVHQDVRTEGAALIEKMNEAKVARATRRERITRLRLVRLVAVALVGAMLMGFSALGMAAAEFVQNREQDQIQENAALQRRALRRERLARLDTNRLKGLDARTRRLLANVALTLTPSEAAAFQRLTAGTVDLAALQDFLVQVMPSDDLAYEVVSEIASHIQPGVAAVDDAVKAAPDAVLAVPRVKAKKKAQEARDQQDREQPQPSEPSPAPSDEPRDTEEPAEEEPREDPDDRDDKDDDTPLQEEEGLDGSPLGG